MPMLYPVGMAASESTWDKAKGQVPPWPDQTLGQPHQLTIHQCVQPSQFLPVKSWVFPLREGEAGSSTSPGPLTHTSWVGLSREKGGMW